MRDPNNLDYFNVSRIEVGTYTAVWYLTWMGQKRKIITTAERGLQGQRALEARKAII